MRWTRRWTMVLAACAGVWLTTPALAFVSSPTGGKPGQVDLKAAANVERGKVEPNEQLDSVQSARWETYDLTATYNLGARGPLHGLYVSAGGSFVDTPAEVHGQGAVPGTCLGRELPGGGCRFYSHDRGGLLKLALGFDVVHTPEHSLGVFVQATAPLALNLDKFVTTRVDYAAVGVTVGVRLSSWLTHTGRVYLGTGAPGRQNATVALTQLLNPEFTLGLPWVLHLGTYFDGDLTERFDARYDAAYTPGYPQARDRIRMMRFGLVGGVTAGIGERLSLELLYVQKVFGYDTPATRFLTLSAQVSLL